MAGFASPWWLIALSVVPLIYWLHRWQAPLTNIPVSAVFLWDSVDSVGAGGEINKFPDPAWRRRAIIASLLVLSLANPWWHRDSGLVSVWIDDSLSMSTVEGGTSRLTEGLKELEKQLRESGVRRATLRSLSNPARFNSSNDPGAFDADTWQVAEWRKPQPLPAALMTGDAAHWLVTDGASSEVVEWVANAPLARIVSVGSTTENVAVTRLAVRPNIESPGFADVLVSASNLGKHDATRELTLKSGLTTLESLRMELLPGESRHWATTQELGNGGLSVSLDQDDTLQLDDLLSLEAPAIVRVPVLLDENCPPDLAVAIGAHPSLLPVETPAIVQLQVSCSDERHIAPAVLRVHVATPEPVANPLEWQPGAGRLQELSLNENWIAASPWDIALNQGHEPLLVSNNVPLVVIRQSGATTSIETVIDMSHPEFSRQPEYAALIAGLVDLALNRPLFSSPTIVTNDPAESTIAPVLLRSRTDDRPATGVVRLSLGAVCAFLACLVLAADIFLLWRAQREARHA